MANTETILIFCGHSDDEVIGMGSTIAKYSQEGKRVITIIFSYGENSSPWLKKDLVKAQRVKEAEAIGKFLGCAETIFLGLRDVKLAQDIKEQNVKVNIKQLIRKYNPNKIFTHSGADPHPDHKAVHRVVLDALDELKANIPLFAFEVWNVVNESHPRIYVDVSSTFRKKIDAMFRFKSQRIFIYSLLIPAYLRAKMIGITNGFKYGERFYKIR